MFNISWGEIVTTLVLFLITLPFLFLIAGESLDYYILATHSSQETIKRFLLSLSFPVRYIFVGLSQKDLTTATQLLATSKDRYKRWATVITRLGFSLGPMIFVIICTYLVIFRGNVVERAIYAGLAIIEFILWYFAMRFGRKLKTMTANDSAKATEQT